MSGHKRKKIHERPRNLHFVSSMSLEEATKHINLLESNDSSIIAKNILPHQHDFTLVYKHRNRTSTVNIKLIRWNQTQTRVECRVGARNLGGVTLKLFQIILGTAILLMIVGFIRNSNLTLALFLSIWVFAVLFIFYTLRERGSLLFDGMEHIEGTALVDLRHNEEQAFDAIVNLFKAKGNVFPL